MILIGRPVTLTIRTNTTSLSVTLPSSVLDGMLDAASTPRPVTRPDLAGFYVVARDSYEENLSFLLDSATGKLYTYWEGVDSDLHAVNTDVETFTSFAGLVAENLVVVEECTWDLLDAAQEVERWLRGVLERIDPWALEQPGGSFWNVVLADIGLGNLTLTAQETPHLKRHLDGSLTSTARWVES